MRKKNFFFFDALLQLYKKKNKNVVRKIIN